MARPEDTDRRVRKAIAHPLRMRLLALLNRKVASPKQLAAELGEPLPNVSYHVKVLAEAGCIELVEALPRRGAVEHFYRAQMRPYFSDEEWAKLPSSTRRSMSDALLREIWSDTAQAMRSGQFDLRDDRHLSRSKLVLDEQGWRDLNDLLAQLLDRAHMIQAESVSRMHASGPDAPSLFSHLAIMHYTGDSAVDQIDVPSEPSTDVELG